jgi:hypothetical protein
MDQMVSAQPGLIPQLSGHLTNLRIMGTTIFVDHFSNHVYAYLMKDFTLLETLMAKHAYKKYLASLGVESKAYCATIDILLTKAFKMTVHLAIRQYLSAELAVIIKIG